MLLLAALFGVGAAERLTLHGVEVREGEGFVATKDLPADAVVVSVPSSEALTAQACFGSGSTILKDVPPAVKTRWARSPALLTACVLDLEKRAPPQWKSYVSALLKTKSHVPLRDSLTANLNASLSGSQVLHELALTFKDVTRLHSELEEYAPSIADWDRASLMHDSLHSWNGWLQELLGEQVGPVRSGVADAVRIDLCRSCKCIRCGDGKGYRGFVGASACARLGLSSARPCERCHPHARIKH
jgi:hypothetical protein